MDLTLLVTGKAVSSSNLFIGELMFLGGKVNFEAGKYTEKEATELKNAKELVSLEKHLARHYCGKFVITETESCWEVYSVNADGTSQKMG